MGSKTKIQWTDGGSTWTPIRARNRKTGKVGWHCTKPSAGCKFCYSEELNMRLGTGLRFVPDANMELFLDPKMLLLPLRWKEPRKIFTCSMTDLFGEFVSNDFIDQVFAVMALAKHQDFLILTKRPERMRDYLLEVQDDDKDMQRWINAAPKVIPHQDTMRGIAAYIEDREWPLENVQCGVTVERREHLSRIDILGETPAARRFISFEPLLEDLGALNLRGIDQAIFGGESGRNARPCDLNWFRKGIAQCRAHGTAPFIKQLGSFAMNGSMPEAPEYRWLTKDRKGGDIEEFPDDLRVREFPDAKL